MDTFTTHEVTDKKEIAYELAAMSELTDMQLLLVGGGSADVFCQ